jgi:tRNA isopentenyl-2-thiomethyl-A-37 hydroxylase MiaE
MDAASLSLIERLISMGTSSLLQYVCESQPWTDENSQALRAKVIAMAQEERDAAARFTRFLQKKHIRIRASASFPSHFTTINFVSIEYLLPKLKAEHEREIAEVETRLRPFEDGEIRTLAQGYLDMKRRHFQTLRELASRAP